MALRSWLFVPGDSEKKLGKAAGFGADVVIVDLEDAVAAPAKPVARERTRSWLAAREGAMPADEAAPQYWVRINPLDSSLWRADLAAIMPARPHGIIVPKASGPEQLRMLAAELYEHEQRAGGASGDTQIVPLVSETARAAMAIPQYAAPEGALPRLAGLSWGAEDLSTAIGASRKRDAQGNWTDLFRFVRAQVLLAAHACGVVAIDTHYSDFKDLDGLGNAARASYSEGFGGMLAIHPGQVPVINAAFTPSEAEVARAWAIVETFAANPGIGALQLEGEMIERPHLDQARRLIERAR